MVKSKRRARKRKKREEKEEEREQEESRYRLSGSNMAFLMRVAGQEGVEVQVL